MIKDVFYQLISEYTADRQLIETAWKEIEQHYSKPGRHYHNLTHLENMLSELSYVQTEVKEWNTILFALFYHDIIYKPTSNHNEEKAPDWRRQD